MVGSNLLKLRNLIKLPLAGMLLFVIFYIVAAIHYPGGSYEAPQATGFSMQHNYLCDLLDRIAINGQLNTAKVYARIAMGFLCFSLILLWGFLPKLFNVTKTVHIITSSFGMLSMIITMFLASGVHDIIVRVAGFCGVIAVLLTFRELYRSNYRGLLNVGFVCLFMLLANYYIYETDRLIEWLPLIQKVAFTSWISWFVTLNLKLINKFSVSRQ